MRSSPAVFGVFAILLAVLAAASCAKSGSVVDAGDGGSGGASAGSGGSVDGSGGAVDPGCTGPLGPPQDPSALPACCSDYGGAHCVPSVPDTLTSFVGQCDGGGYCVPDDFIKTGGVFTPKACTSINGPGTCLSLCIPQVESYKSLLKKDVCADTELCVPCISPLDNKDTGACKIGFTCDMASGGAGGGTSAGTGAGGADPGACPHMGPPVLDPSSLPACPMCGGGHCVNNGLVPPDQAGKLAPCDAMTTCVPDTLIETGGNFILPTCKSVGGVEGRCASKCIPQVAMQAASLPQDICTADEVCAPCYDPLSGDDTGICKLSCDPGPAGPPMKLPGCCGSLGTCVPSASVPPDELSKFGGDVCPPGAGLVCVPDAFVPGGVAPPGDKTKQMCSTSFLFQLAFGFDPKYASGVCLPKCMPDVDKAPFPIGDGSCDDDNYKCIPCNDPQNNGQPTGACGQ
jgi:hypothetical protein